MKALKARRGATAHAKCRADWGCSSPRAASVPSCPPEGRLLLNVCQSPCLPLFRGTAYGARTAARQALFSCVQTPAALQLPKPLRRLPHRRRTARDLCWLLSRTTVAQVVSVVRIGGSRLSPLRSPLCKHHDLATTPKWPFRLFSSLAITNKAPTHATARLWIGTNAPFWADSGRCPTQLSKAALLAYTPPALGTATLLTCSPPGGVCSRTLSLTSGDNRG